jgi:hypothetical protein
MRYAMLIYADESRAPAEGSAEWQTSMADYGAFTQAVQERNMMRGGEALLPSSTATTVRVRGGERLITDGPFAETKEQLGGFYLLDCADLDEAIAYAARIPGAQAGSIEIRPIMEFN